MFWTWITVALSQSRGSVANSESAVGMSRALRVLTKFRSHSQMPRSAEPYSLAEIIIQIFYSFFKFFLSELISRMIELHLQEIQTISQSGAQSAIMRDLRGGARTRSRKTRKNELSWVVFETYSKSRFPNRNRTRFSRHFQIPGSSNACTISNRW